MNNPEEILQSELAEIIEAGRRKWRVPLFILGAGVSSSRVPIMSEVFGYFLKGDVIPQDDDAFRCFRL